MIHFLLMCLCPSSYFECSPGTTAWMPRRLLGGRLPPMCYGKRSSSSCREPAQSTCRCLPTYIPPPLLLQLHLMTSTLGSCISSPSSPGKFWRQTRPSCPSSPSARPPFAIDFSRGCHLLHLPLSYRGSPCSYTGLSCWWMSLEMMKTGTPDHRALGTLLLCLHPLLRLRRTNRRSRAVFGGSHAILPTLQSLHRHCSNFHRSQNLGTVFGPLNFWLSL